MFVSHLPDIHSSTVTVLIRVLFLGIHFEIQNNLQDGFSQDNICNISCINALIKKQKKQLKNMNILIQYKISLCCQSFKDEYVKLQQKFKICAHVSGTYEKSILQFTWYKYIQFHTLPVSISYTRSSLFMTSVMITERSVGLTASSKWMPEDRCLFNKAFYRKQDTNIKKDSKLHILWIILCIHFYITFIFKTLVLMNKLWKTIQHHIQSQQN